jgi:hypothetical protein
MTRHPAQAEPGYRTGLDGPIEAMRQSDTPPTHEGTDMTDTTTLAENIVPVAFIEVVREKLATFAARCAKKGMPTPVLTLGKQEQRIVCRLSGGTHVHDAACPRAPFQSITLEGETPRIGPWSLVASIDNVGGQPFFRPVPGQDVPERFRNTDPTACDYCKKNITTRLETFIVHNSDTDEFQQVGRQCIRDFLGWDVNVIVRWFEFINDLIGEYDEDRDWGVYVRPEYKPEEIVRLASLVASVDGRYIKSENGEDSTKNKVLDLLNPPRGGTQAYERWLVEVFNKYNSQPDLAERIYDATLVALDSLNTSSDWAYNVDVATRAEYIGARQVGVVASAVILGLRAIEDDMNARRDEIAADKPSNEFIGNVGEKVSIPVTILDSRFFDSNYGGSYLITMADEHGNSIKWFASKNIPEGMTTAHITGTVKKHEEFKGRKSTMLTRCKMEAF